MIAGAALLLLGTLYDQSLEKLLDRQFPNRAISYILLDSKTGRIAAERWIGPERPVPAGSLVKPFVALAASPDGSFPVLQCDPNQCWFRKGHGAVDITTAIANSCNSYFLQLAPQATPDFLERFGLAPPPRAASPETWIGLGREWKLAPLALVRAYRLLATYPQAEPIRTGMARSALTGTGKAFAAKALVKTGTSACSHREGQPGDGYVVAITPQYVLLVQQHGVPGATAAGTGGKMLRVVLTGK